MSLLDKLSEDSIINNNLNLSLIYAKAGNSELKMDIDKKVLNLYGIVHGGAIFTLADSAAGAAAISFNDAYVTADAHINFIKPGNGKYLIAKAKTLHKGSKTVIVEVTVLNDQSELIAKGSYTMYKVENSA